MPWVLRFNWYLRLRINGTGSLKRYSAKGKLFSIILYVSSCFSNYRFTIQYRDRITLVAWYFSLKIFPTFRRWIEKGKKRRRREEGRKRERGKKFFDENRAGCSPPRSEQAFASNENWLVQRSKQRAGTFN